jgi:hypothetical protein
MKLSAAQQRLLEQLVVDPERGLTSAQASQRRDDGLNIVNPPVNCPAWICCLLPCIKSIPSMKAFQQIKPEDAEVLRDGRWIRYDATSLVRGDILRLEEGDVVPADCVVLSLDGDGGPDLLVDLRNITGEDKPRSSSVKSEDGTVQPVQLFYGGKVVQGSGVAVVTATGSGTLLASLIRDGRFPPKGNVLLKEGQLPDMEEETGISLMSHDNL